MRFINTHRLFLVCFFIFYSQKVNGSSLNFDQQNLKLLTSEDGTLTNSTENDQTKYTITNNASGTQFTFNPNSKCVGVKYNNQIFWLHINSEHGDNYPTSVFIDSQDHDVTVFLGNMWYYNYKTHLNSYTLDSFKKPLTQDEFPQEVQLFDANGTNEMPINKYKVVSYFKSGEPKQVFYYLNDQCGMIKCNGQEVWKHELTSGNPKSMAYLKEQIILEFDDGYEVYKKSENGWNLVSSEYKTEQQDDEQDQQDQTDSSLRGSSSENTKSTKDKSTKSQNGSEKFPDTLADALVLVIMLSIIATIMVVLVLLMSIGLTFFINKKAKVESLMSGRVDYV